MTMTATGTHTNAGVLIVLKEAFFNQGNLIQPGINADTGPSNSFCSTEFSYAGDTACEVSDGTNLKVSIAFPLNSGGASI